MKPITKGKISSKLAPDSSHLSALDLHSRGGEALCFGPGNKESVQQEVNNLFNLLSTLVPPVQQLKAIANKSQISQRII